MTDPLVARILAQRNALAGNHAAHPLSDGQVHLHVDNLVIHVPEGAIQIPPNHVEVHVPEHPAPGVNVHPSTANVNVKVPNPKPRHIEFERDEMGRIKGADVTDG